MFDNIMLSITSFLFSNAVQTQIFEIKYMPQTPVNVAVSEAINISQKYTYQDDTAFINGVLGAYTRSLPAREEATSTVQEDA